MYKTGDFVLLSDWGISKIKEVSNTDVLIGEEIYSYAAVEPIPIENVAVDFLRRKLVLINSIPMASLIDNGIERIAAPEIKINLDFLSEAEIYGKESWQCLYHSGRYWLLTDISKSFLEEKRIEYVHELQHYLSDTKSYLHVGLE
ncbi:hypothetical protein [Bacteroides sp.]|uniref:hypothetical protein n=1 Tax=Bacteroides sp. TaxID=29523 RepID=UPI003D0EA507